MFHKKKLKNDFRFGCFKKFEFLCILKPDVIPGKYGEVWFKTTKFRIRFLIKISKSKNI